MVTHTAGKSGASPKREIETSPDSGKIVLRPDAGTLSRHIASVYQTLSEQWIRNGFEAPELRLRIVLEEAIINAWRHGNRRDPALAVTVCWRFDRSFHLEVIDEGDGFDVDTLPDPTEAVNLTHPSGRGIFLIRHFSKEMNWKNGGRHLALSLDKNTNAQAGKRSSDYGTHRERN